MQQETRTNVRLDQMRGQHVYDNAGERIGTVEEIFYDHETSAPEWIGIGTGFLGTKRVLVPVDGARVTEDGLVVAYAKDKVKDSPDIDSDEISAEQEAELTSYYGLGYTGRDTSGGAQQPAGETITRSEEELRVGKQSVEAGRVRLRKWVETEPVALDVELHHETAQVTREPVEAGAADTSGAFQEQEIEVPLRAEQPIVEKDVVAKERIGLQTQVETTTQRVEDEVRKERVDVDSDGGVVEQ